MILRLLARRRTGRRTAIPARTVETPRRSSVNLFKGHTTSSQEQTAVNRRSPRATGRTARLTRSPLGRDRARDDTLTKGSPLDIRSDRERNRISKMVHQAMSKANGNPTAATSALRREAQEHLETAARAARQNANGDEQLLLCIDAIRRRILTAREIEPHATETAEAPERAIDRTTLTQTIADGVGSKRRA